VQGLQQVEVLIIRQRAAGPASRPPRPGLPTHYVTFLRGSGRELGQSGGSVVKLPASSKQLICQELIALGHRDAMPRRKSCSVFLDYSARSDPPTPIGQADQPGIRIAIQPDLGHGPIAAQASVVCAQAGVDPSVLPAGFDCPQRVESLDFLIPDPGVKRWLACSNQRRCARGDHFGLI